MRRYGVEVLDRVTGKGQVLTVEADSAEAAAAQAAASGWVVGRVVELKPAGEVASIAPMDATTPPTGGAGSSSTSVSRGTALSVFAVATWVLTLWTVFMSGPSANDAKLRFEDSLNRGFPPTDRERLELSQKEAMDEAWRLRAMVTGSSLAILLALLRRR